jgi:hypothetical protein
MDDETIAARKSIRPAKTEGLEGHVRVVEDGVHPRLDSVRDSDGLLPAFATGRKASGQYETGESRSEIAR